MTEFGSREQGFERKFELDEELHFKIVSRAAHLFGLWAAGQLGLKGEAAEVYAQRAVDTVVLKSGSALLIANTEKDFKSQGKDVTLHRIEREFESSFQSARSQFMN